MNIMQSGMIQEPVVKGNLYLVPSLLAESLPGASFPPYNLEVIKKLKIYFVENIRSARRFISSLKMEISIEELTFHTLDKETDQQQLDFMVRVLLEGNDAGIMDEAGCPGIDDPGSRLVTLAHRHQIKVIPLVGPSSILLALIASGFNGQNFAFTGYLPIREHERERKIIELEARMIRDNQTQIFMETPFRNDSLIKSLLKTLKPETLLSISADLTGPGEQIHTYPVKSWKNRKISLNRVPAIFLIYHT